ncbi:hypothetical protein GN244_ATG15288 [Phytophthora infestans]|uniref:RxLR effector protein n=1 Tax=Phytophthora infestans TaxID=4787 RepID=A0A833WP94_PHYIN|nr:hypothetical protein GN244_ATG15288 [Phytophthora infestans]
MWPYKTLLLALGFFFTIQCHLLAEERGALDALKSELSFLKLNWAARSKVTPEDKLVAKQAKELSKTQQKLSKTKEKLQAEAAKAEQKVKDQATKTEQKLKAKKDIADQQLKALQQKELKRLTKEASKQDEMYNRWLVADKTPEDVYKKFKFDEQAKKGDDLTNSLNYKHYENYKAIYYSRYPDRLEKLAA